VEVVDAGAYGETDVENGMILGAESAGTGPLLAFTWDGIAPGVPFVPPLTLVDQATLSLAGRGTIDHLALVGSGGSILAELDVVADGSFAVDEPGLPGNWVLAVGWSSAGPDWAVTGPVWIDPPGTGG
jgi:hypothetical protein